MLISIVLRRKILNGETPTYRVSQGGAGAMHGQVHDLGSCHLASR